MLRLHRDQRGAGVLEYAIMVSVIAMVSIFGIAAMGGEVNRGYNQIGQELDSASTGSAQGQEDKEPVVYVGLVEDEDEQLSAD